MNTIILLSNFKWNIKWKAAMQLASDSTSRLRFILPRSLQQDLILILCQGKSSESEHGLPKRFLANYKVFSSGDVQQALSCLSRACLFLRLHGLVMPCSTEKAARHVWNVYSCCQDTEGGSSGPCAELLATESVPGQGLQMCRLTGRLLMRGPKAASSTFWAILSHSSK